MARVALYLLACGLAACGHDSNAAYSAQWENAHLAQNKALLTTDWDVLHAPDRLELFTLSHHSVNGEERSDLATDQVFHNYPILGRADIVDRVSQRQLVEGFYQSSREGDGEMM